MGQFSCHEFPFFLPEFLTIERPLSVPGCGAYVRKGCVPGGLTGDFAIKMPHFPAELLNLSHIQNIDN